MIYQMALILESSAGDLPDTYGILWSMPDTESLPESKSMQATIMLKSSAASNQKIQSNFDVLGDIEMTVGKSPFSSR